MPGISSRKLTAVRQLEENCNQKQDEGKKKMCEIEITCEQLKSW
jgi:hypothetical protein